MCFTHDHCSQHKPFPPSPTFPSNFGVVRTLGNECWMSAPGRINIGELSSLSILPYVYAMRIRGKGRHNLASDISLPKIADEAPPANREPFRSSLGGFSVAPRPATRTLIRSTNWDCLQSGSNTDKVQETLHLTNSSDSLPHIAE